MFDLDSAIQIAALAHSGRVDKSGQPYILHPLRVMLSFTDHDDQIVSVLHDVIEDSHCSIDNLRDVGLRADLCEDLDALTRRKTETYTGYILRLSYRERACRIKACRSLGQSITDISTS